MNENSTFKPLYAFVIFAHCEPYLGIHWGRCSSHFSLLLLHVSQAVGNFQAVFGTFATKGSKLGERKLSNEGGPGKIKRERQNTPVIRYHQSPLELQLYVAEFT